MVNSSVRALVIMTLHSGDSEQRVRRPNYTYIYLGFRYTHWTFIVAFLSSCSELGDCNMINALACWHN